MGRAFYGYVNKITENGKKYVTQKERKLPSIHEPLISEELFKKVQNIMDGNANLARPNVKNIVRR